MRILSEKQEKHLSALMKVAENDLDLVIRSFHCATLEDQVKYIILEVQKKKRKYLEDKFIPK